MNFVDYVAGGLVALGFLNGTRRGVAMELYRFITTAVVVLAGCSLYTFLGKALSFVPGLDPARYGIVGYIAVIIASYFLVRFLMRSLKSKLKEKFGDDKSGTKGGIVGLLRSATVVVGGLTGLALSNFSWVTEGSAIGRLISGFIRA